MYLRAIVAFLALPGIVAGVIPTLIVASDDYRGRGSLIGYPVLLLGVTLLLWCVRDFLVAGRGTLAPWDPPQHLVVVGLYRFVRNPMYIAVIVLLSGECIMTGSRLVAVYAVLVGIAFHIRVLFYEEPWLRRQFAEEAEHYLSSVPRWVPRLTLWRRE